MDTTLNIMFAGIMDIADCPMSMWKFYPDWLKKYTYVLFFYHILGSFLFLFGSLEPHPVAIGAYARLCVNEGAMCKALNTTFWFFFWPLFYILDVDIIEQEENLSKCLELYNKYFLGEILSIYIFYKSGKLVNQIYLKALS